MTSSRPCPGCRGRNSRPFGVANGFAIRVCRDCGTLFTAALPGADQTEDYDEYYDAGNLTVPAFVDERLGEIVSAFDRYRGSNRWLDVGCGAGALMRAAARGGWRVTGTEVALAAAERVRQDGFDVRVGELGDLDLSAGEFDVVSAVEVVEHVPDPDALLRECARLLRPGGALYVTTPHARGLSARALKDRWTLIAPPEHLQLFSIPGLRSAATRTGLTVRTLRTRGADPRAVVAGLRGRTPQSGDARVEDAYRLNEALSSSRMRRAAKSGVNGVLGLTRMGDGLNLVAERAPGGQDLTTPRAAGTPRG